MRRPTRTLPRTGPLSQAGDPRMDGHRAVLY
ncbi:hypothetical protein STPYR_10713 [uncultured Stenotrophomonas sp.]|uniref:Uncharacterized protein n=1 Tax=uncultured Stenotrophomonas sp. TaxID=165438 RepID=A0A1Y5Q0K3_9GAMM|nr:hypothetical protein STPYR_10713 [uncultured Stenotrophomonas sp.]